MGPRRSASFQNHSNAPSSAANPLRSTSSGGDLTARASLTYYERVNSSGDLTASASASASASEAAALSVVDDKAWDALIEKIGSVEAAVEHLHEHVEVTTHPTVP